MASFAEINTGEGHVDFEMCEHEAGKGAGRQICNSGFRAKIRAGEKSREMSV